MAKRAAKVLPRAESKADPPIARDLDPGEMPEPPPRPKRGRPSKAEVEARKASYAMAPSEMRPVTQAALGALALAIKGDAATAEEIELVNGPLTAVCNKYDVMSRWLPELSLLGALLVVSGNMRARRVKVVEVSLEKRNPSGDGAQGLGQIQPSAPVLAPATADSNG